MSEENKKKGQRKHKGPLIFCFVLLGLLLLLLGVLVWQLIRLNNGEKLIISLPGTKTADSRSLPEPAGDPETTAAAADTASTDALPAEGGETTAAGTEGNPADTSAPAQVQPAAAQPLSSETSAILAAAREAGVTIVPVSTPVPGPTYTPKAFATDEAGNLIIPAQEAGRFQGEPYFAPTIAATGDPVLDAANRQAAMYDYDEAIRILTEMPGYENNQAYTAAIAEYEQRKSELKQWGRNSQITHIFFHSLSVDTSRTFSHEIAINEQDGSDKVNAYNEVMTTIDEFVAILEQMYARGYVLVRLTDIAKMVTNPDGTTTMQYQPIMLPEGKTPFVMSQDDVSYYAYMHGHGFATKMVLNEAGRPVAEYEMPDGSKIYGAYDLVPIVDDFIEAHPDFSYHGAKGIIALTGYEGILGYRTSDYWYNWNCEYFQPEQAANREKLYFNNENIEQDKKAASAVAAAMRADGWEFASHSWSHRDLQQRDADFVAWDTDMWNKEVAPLVGGTDIIIFPKGADIDSWRGYAADNPKFLTYKQYGFNYFCNVDSSQYWIQIGANKDYFRMGRRNIDGTRLWQAVSWYANPAGYDWSEQTIIDRTLNDLIDARTVFDWARPTPVE